MVCMGNICRSPMAAAVLSNRSAGWDKPKIIVDSSGTSAWHVGQGPHPTSLKVWESAGYKHMHAARQFKASDFYTTDLILVMDASNYRSVIDLADSDESRSKVFYLRSFDDSLNSIEPMSEEFSRLEVPDPYDQSVEAYIKTLTIIEHAINNLLQELKSQ